MYIIYGPERLIKKGPVDGGRKLQITYGNPCGNFWLEMVNIEPEAEGLCPKWDLLIAARRLRHKLGSKTDPTNL